MIMLSFGLSCEPIIFLYNVIIVINYCTVPQLLLKKSCLRESGYNVTACDDLGKITDAIHHEASNWWLYLLLCFQVPSTFTILIWGSITDFVGRRKALIFAPIADTVCTLGFILNSYYIDSHPAYLIIGYLAVSLFGEMPGFLSLCYAYTADLTRDQFHQRTSKMALVEVSVSLAGALAGFLSGFLLQAKGFLAVIGFTLGIDILILLYVLYLLPNIKDALDETDTTKLIYLNNSENELPRNSEDSGDDQDDISPRNFDTSKYIQEIRNLCKDVIEKKVIIPLIISFSFVYYAYRGEQISQTLFVKDKPFLFSPEKVGYYVAFQATSRGIAVLVITQLSFHLLNLNDYSLIVMGAFSQVMSYILIGISNSTLSIFLACSVGFGPQLAMAVIRSVITKNIPSNKYGTMLSVLGSISTAAGATSNTISWFIRNDASSSITGTVYFGLAGVSTLAMIIIVITYIKFERFRL